MSAEQNILTLRRVIEAGFNQCNLDELDDCFATPYTENQFDLAQQPGLVGLKNSIRYLHRAFSNYSLTIEDLIAQEDKVWVRLTCRGQNTGEFMGRPPTGKSFEITVFDVCRFINGKIIEHWGVPDRFHMIQQLGLMP
jgi:predicted ester cyclase